MKTEEGRVSHLRTVSFRAGGEGRASEHSSEGSWSSPGGKKERMPGRATDGSWQLVC